MLSQSENRLQGLVSVMVLAGVAFLAGCNTGSHTQKIVVGLTPSAAQAIDIGQSVAITAAVTGDSSNKGVTWTASGVGALQGASTTGVTYVAPATGAGGTATVTGTSVASATSTSTLNISVLPLPNITTKELSAGTQGAAYSQTLAETGGAGTLTYSLTGGGGLPAGLTLSSAGVISGTPAGPNTTSTFTVKLTDSSTAGPQFTTQGLSITISAAAAPVISPVTLPNATVGSPYSQNLTVTGGVGPAYTWAVSSGALPAGLTLAGTTSTATITGTPTGIAPGVVGQNKASRPVKEITQNASFTVKVTDSGNPAQSATQAYTLTINPAGALSITTASLPNGTYPNAYSTKISATGGVPPYTFSKDAASAALPAGLALTNSNNQGVLSVGALTGAGTFPGIIIDVKDSQVPAATASFTYSLTITAPAVAITPAAGALPAATQGTAYTQSFTPSGGVGPYTITEAGALPTGVTFTGTAASNGTATLAGTPTVSGAFNSIVVTVKDSETPAVSKQFTYTLTVNANAAACGSGSESELNGQYAFSLGGLAKLSAGKQSDPYTLLGSFTADGTGKITTGVEDIGMDSDAGVGSSAAATITGVGSSYSVGSDQRGCMTLATSLGTQTFRFALVGAPAIQGYIVEFDNSGNSISGIMRKQSSSAFSTTAGTGFNGNYAFQLGGLTPNFTYDWGLVGSFATNAGGGSISTGSWDYNDTSGTATELDGGSAWPATGLAFPAGMTYSVSGIGRGTIQLPSSHVYANSGGNQTLTPATYVFYVVSANEMLAAIVPDANNEPLSGVIQKQVGLPFGNGVLTQGNGNFVLFAGGNGPDNVGNPIDHNNAGIFTTTTAGQFSFSGVGNTAGLISNPVQYTGTYTIDGTTGRMKTTVASGPESPIFYVVDGATLLGVNGTDSADTGAVQPQATGPFALSGTYAFGTITPTGFDTPTSAVPDLATGTITFDGHGNATVTQDLVQYDPFTLTPAQPGTETYSVNAVTGQGQIPATGTPSLIFYIINVNQIVLIDVTSGHSAPAITLLTAVRPAA